jgi:hypothetical protein
MAAAPQLPDRPGDSRNDILIMELTPHATKARFRRTMQEPSRFSHVWRARPYADKIPEITPEMIRAGQRCLDELFDATVDAGSDAGLMCIPGGWAEAVYLAMTDTSGRQREAPDPKSPD